MSDRTVDDTGWFKSSFSDNSTPACVECRIIDGDVFVRDSKDPGAPPLRFTSNEWAAFLHRVKAGEFDLRG